MSDITLEALRLREKELSIDAVMIRGRIEELRHIIAEMERRRGGRPRKPAGVASIPGRMAGALYGEPAIIPQRVEGGEHETETDDHLFPGEAAQ